MKIKPEHLEHMRAAIAALLERYPTAAAAYEAGNFPRADNVKNLQERFCFDLSHAAGLTTWLCANVYPYANDEHVYTALRAVCPKVTRNY